MDKRLTEPVLSLICDMIDYGESRLMNGKDSDETEAWSLRLFEALTAIRLNAGSEAEIDRARHVITYLFIGVQRAQDITVFTNHALIQQYGREGIRQVIDAMKGEFPGLRGENVDGVIEGMLDTEEKERDGGNENE